MDQNNIPTIEIGQISTKPQIHKSFSHGDLLNVMYFIWDAFDKTGIKFFPVRETARLMLAEKELEGDYLDIGVRALEFNKDARFVINSYFDNMKCIVNKQTDMLWECKYAGIPFTLHIYPENECIHELDQRQYEYEAWYFPQRFEEFCERYDK